MKTADEQVLGRLKTCAHRIGQLDVMADAERRARGSLIDEARAAGVPMRRIAAALGIARRPAQRLTSQGDFCPACGGDLVVTSVSATCYETTCQKCATARVLVTLEGEPA